MGLTLKHETGGLWVLQVSGVLRKSELDGVQATGAAQLGATGKTKILVLVEDFSGWEKGADWGDMTFFLKYGDQIERIAIVADPKWKTEWLAFAGAGFRRAPVEFFAIGQAAAARAWLG